MSSPRLQTQPASPIEQSRPTPTEPATETPRSVANTVPATFEYGNSTQLENLIDEFNAAFANPDGE